MLLAAQCQALLRPGPKTRMLPPGRCIIGSREKYDKGESFTSTSHDKRASPLSFSVYRLALVAVIGSLVPFAGTTLV